MYTLLLFLCPLGALEACKVIVSQVGTHCLNDVDTQNRTCLHLAAMAAHGEVLNYLLEQGGKYIIAAFKES